MKLVFILLVCTTNLFAAFIHPRMKEAIENNKRGIVGHDSIVIDGKRYPTGFKPKEDFYLGANYLDIKIDPKVKLPRSFDMRTKSYSPVHGQIQGSCWAEATTGAFELTWNFITGLKEVFAVNDVIDCSNYGTAWSGGQPALPYAVKAGLALEKDYRYTGRDGRCKKDVERYRPLKSAPFLRSADGKFFTVPELKYAIWKYGAITVCGASRSLGSGGRQDTIRNGVTDHCYVTLGWKNGLDEGWLDADYFIEKNSWGDCSNSALNLSGGCWGDKGYAYMRISRDGVNIEGDNITEAQLAITGLEMPHAPTEPDQWDINSKVIKAKAKMKNLSDSEPYKKAIDKTLKSLERQK